MSSLTALVVGGTGPTGPLIISGLLERGYDVKILHRGTHEPPDLPDVAHIHADPHFEDPLREAVGSSEFDLVAAMYGRAAIVSRVLAGRCERYLSVSGVPVYTGFNEPHLFEPFGMAIGATEHRNLVDTIDHPGSDLPIAVTFAQKVLSTESVVFGHHPDATIFRYPMIYGRRNLIPWEWAVVKRVLDGRPWMLLPDHGTSIYARCAAENAAHSFLLAVDNPERAKGEAFNVADDEQFTLHQWVDILSSAVGRRLAIRSVPSELCRRWADALQQQAGNISPHTLVANTKIRESLGYRDVIAPQAALAQTAQWFVDNPVVDSAPGFLELFDYDTEDRLVEAYGALAAEILARFPENRPEPFHAMPHPRVPGLDDARGR